MILLKTVNQQNIVQYFSPLIMCKFSRQNKKLVPACSTYQKIHESVHIYYVCKIYLFYVSLGQRRNIILGRFQMLYYFETHIKLFWIKYRGPIPSKRVNMHTSGKYTILFGHLNYAF